MPRDMISHYTPKAARAAFRAFHNFHIQFLLFYMW